MALALIDADTIYFRAAYKKNKDQIKRAIDEQMRKIDGVHFWDGMHVAVKGFGNYRKDLYPQYKANRKRDEELKPYLAIGWEHMKEKWNAIEAHGMEADDLVSIWAYEAREDEQAFVICGIDKDLKQIPGEHYNYHKDTWEFIDDDTANLNLMLQCLTGDTGDNIPGIKGIGPKKAEKILAHVPMERRWNRVRAAWRAHDAGDPALSLQLLSMLKSWEELDDIRQQIHGETTISERDDGKEQDIPDRSVHSISKRDT